MNCFKTLFLEVDMPRSFVIGLAHKCFASYAPLAVTPTLFTKLFWKFSKVSDLHGHLGWYVGISRHQFVFIFHITRTLYSNYQGLLLYYVRLCWCLVLWTTDLGPAFCTPLLTCSSSWWLEVYKVLALRSVKTGMILIRPCLGLTGKTSFLIGCLAILWKYK